MNKQALQRKQIALVGCGDIGSRLAPLLIAAGAVVSGFRRNPDKLPEGIIHYRLDVSKPETMGVLNSQTFDYVVITLGPNEMSDAAYEATYVNGLRNILSQLNTSRLRKLFWVSSTSVYGQVDGSQVDETSATNPLRYAGQRQLEAEQLLSVLGEKACVVRFSGIYRADRHHLVEQVRAGKCGSRFEHDYFTNRIHVSDCASVLGHLIGLDAEGKKLDSVYLATDSMPARYSEVIQWLANVMGVCLDPDAEIQIPRVGSKRCSNARLIASGYQFIYPSYQEGFREIIRSLEISDQAP